MTADERSELASLHAMSLLGADEARVAARLAETDPDFAAEVDWFTEAMAGLAASYPAVEPSEISKHRVLSITRSAPRKPSNAWAGWAAAAAVTVGFFWLWGDRDRAWTESRKSAVLEKEARTDRDQSHRLLTELQQQSSLATVRIASLESKVQEFESTRAVVVWDESHHNGLIRLTGLPAAGKGKDYQLWVVDPGKTAAVNAGLIHRDESGTASVSFKPDQKIGTASAFAISIEKTGGVKVAEGPIVLVGN